MHEFKLQAAAIAQGRPQCSRAMQCNALSVCVCVYIWNSYIFLYAFLLGTNHNDNKTKQNKTVLLALVKHASVLYA